MKLYLFATIATMAILVHQTKSLTDIVTGNLSCYYCNDFENCKNYTRFVTDNHLSCIVLRDKDGLAYYRHGGWSDCSNLKYLGIEVFLGSNTLECCEDVDYCNSANKLFITTISMSAIVAAWHLFSN